MPRILLVKTSSMGDVVHNLPLVSDIARHVPGAQMDWVVEEAFADIPAMHPAIGHVIPVAVRRWRRAAFAPRTWREVRRFLGALRARRYDVVLDSQGLLKSAAIAALAYGPVHGHDWRSARETLAALFYSKRYPVARGAHAVTRNRALAAAVFGYASAADPPDYGIHAPAGSPAPLPSSYVVFLHATSRDSKLWPEPHWLDLGAQLARENLAAVLPWGSAPELERAQRLAAKLPGAVVLPRLGLAALAQALQGARAVIGVDTGLVHLATALARPTVALYTDTDPALTGVAPSDPALAINLGNKGVIPPVADVMTSLGRIRALPAVRA